MQTRLRLASWACALAVALPAGQALALDELQFVVVNGDRSLGRDLSAASALMQARSNETTEPQDILAAARAEYGRLLGVLYARGHYSGVIHVLVDGREASTIPPLNVPARISRVEVRVEPGRPFVFGVARVDPVTRETELPEGFSRGETAESGLISSAAQAGVDGWRAEGHAKAAVSGQEIVAHHPERVLDADIRLNPGPALRFGRLTVQGNERMRLNRIIAIAGLREGRRYNPEELDRVAERLRRTGIFRSVSLIEDEAITAPDLLGITALLIEEKRRRYQFGAELSSLEGATVSGEWLHRNLRGGGERLRIYGEVAQIGAQSSGMDYTLGVTLERPATITADTTAQAYAEIGRLDEDDYTSDYAKLGIGFTQYVSSKLTLRAALQYSHSEVTDQTGDYTYRSISLPMGARRDSRDNPIDARDGSYYDVELKPFVGFDGSESGARLAADGRIYRSFGRDDRVTFAARMQVGAVFGSSLLGTPREDLFYSGGGGTVRGQPYQSLGVELDDDFTIGGKAFLGASAEARVRITERIGVVGFVDWGHVGADDFFDGQGGEHAGAGLGLRYDTGFGPIRLDVAAPVSGDTDEGVQIYVGIGQAF